MSQAQRDELDALLRQTPRDDGAPIAAQRAALERKNAATPLPPDVVTARCHLGGVPALAVRTDGVALSRTVLYFHGGAYALGSAATSVGLAQEVGRRAEALVVSVDYRLAPEHPFPAALDDALAAYRALLDDAVRLAERALSFDVPVRLQVWPNLPHVFQGFASVVDDAAAALDVVGAFLAGHWSTDTDEG